MNKILNLRHLIELFRSKNLITDIYHEVDPKLELAEIHRRVVAARGPALLFHNVKGSPFRVATNLFGTLERVLLSFPNHPEKTLENLIHLATKEFPPTLSTLWEKRGELKQLLNLGTKKRRWKAPVEEVVMSPVDLEKLPILTSWEEDGGPFLTLPLVYTESPLGDPPNLGMYRIQRFDKNTTGLHFQIGKGGGYHYHQAEQMGKNLPVSIFLGGSPALIISAITPLPENVPELMLAGFLQGEKLSLRYPQKGGMPLISECEFALVGHAKPKERRAEGPFGDHYGYYSLTHDFPVFHCEKVYHRKDAIFPATIVGKPKQEDYFIGEYLQELLSPLFPMVMPGVKDLWSYGQCGFHSLSAAIVKERFHREALIHGFRILGEGQLSLSKFLLLTDQNVNLKNFTEVLTTVLERFQPERDLYIFSNLSLDTLDYTGPALNKGSRGLLVGLGEKVRDLPDSFIGNLPRPFTKLCVFSPGCLVVEVEKNTTPEDYQGAIDQLSQYNFPLIIVCDDCEKATKNETNFLWTVFTRFEPAADITTKSSKVFRHHICYELPICIDARMKPSYPKALECDERTHDTVTKNWDKYFTSPVEMGNSLDADVYTHS